MSCLIEMVSKANARREVMVGDQVVKECPGRLMRLVLARVVLLRFRCKSWLE